MQLLQMYSSNCSVQVSNSTNSTTYLASSPGSTSAPPTTGQSIKRRGGSLVSNVACRTPQLSNVGGYYAPPTQLHSTVDKPWRNGLYTFSLWIQRVALTIAFLQTVNHPFFHPEFVLIVLQAINERAECGRMD